MSARALVIGDRGPGPTRRTVVSATAGLACAAGVASLSGCRVRVGSPSANGASATQSPAGSPDNGTPDPNRAALMAAGAQAQLLLDTYRTAGARRPDLAAELSRLQADHISQLAALEALGVEPASAGTGSTSTTATTATTATTSTTSTSGDPASFPALTAANAVSVVAQVERYVAAARVRDLAALDGRTARLLASMAACSDQHLTLLARLPSTARHRGEG